MPKKISFQVISPTAHIDVGIMMGSGSDIPIMVKAKNILDKFEIPYDAKIGSAHRTPDDVDEIVKDWIERGCKVIIAGAGWAAHLAGAIAGKTVIPIAAVPIASSPLNGIDALLATVQMPPGIPVATVAVNCADNAAYLAVQIIATTKRELQEKLFNDRTRMAIKIRDESYELATNKVWNDFDENGQPKKK